MSARDYRSTHAALAGSVLTMLLNHPDAFDVLLYRPDLAHPETVAPGADVVGALDSKERTLEYADPVPAKAMLVPEFEPVTLTLDGDRPDGVTVEPVVVLLSVSDVPEQSVIQWSEYVDATNTRDIAMYVVDGKQVGVAPGVCSKLYCLPMQAFGDLL